MKHLSVLLTTLSTVVVSTISISTISESATAANFSGNSSGIWGNPNPGINQNPQTTGVGTNTFTWGRACLAGDINPCPQNAVFGTPPNKLTFNGSAFNTNIGSQFKIGNLSYFNGTVLEDTSVESVPLNLTVSFADIGITKNFDFRFMLHNTPNLGTPTENADYITVLNQVSEQTFFYQDKEYTLELTGFSEKNGFVNFFSVLEGEDTTASIYGTIKQVIRPKTIPEPGAIAGLSVLGIYLLCRRQNFSRSRGN